MPQNVRNTALPGGGILLYHRVGEAGRDPHQLCVDSRHFEEHLQVLRLNWSPMPLNDLVVAGLDGRAPQGAVAVTLDDGYADSLLNARPMLARWDVPATVFVVSGAVGGRREFWWDEVERLLLGPGSLPAHLLLRIEGVEEVWDLGAAADYPPSEAARHQGWHFGSADDPTPRHTAYRSVHARLRALSKYERTAVLDELVALGCEQTLARTTHLPLTVGQLLQLADGGLVEVGAHSVTHPLLSRLDLTTQRSEILGCKHQLEAMLGRPVRSFSYPNGGRADYDANSVALVCGVGFDRACSNFPGRVWRDADPFQLPRFRVRDWDGEEFSRRLGQWFEAGPNPVAETA